MYIITVIEYSQHKIVNVHVTGNSETIHRADIRLSDICNLLSMDWIPLALELGLTQTDINLIQNEYHNNVRQQAMVMLRLWMQSKGNQATGNLTHRNFTKIVKLVIL